MKVDSIVVYRSFISAIRKIRDLEERCRAYDAMFDYGLDHIDVDLDDGAGIALELIKPLLDSQFQKKMTNRENGKRGGRPRGEAVISDEESDVITEKNPEETENNRTETEKNPEETENNRTETEKKRKKPNHNPNVNVNGNVNENVNGNDNYMRFAKPTIEEVIAYCRERNNNVDAQRWYDYYSANGWKVGRNPMKDWKACVRTWERNSTREEQEITYDTTKNSKLSKEEMEELLKLRGEK